MPTELGRLTRLEKLVLYDNSLSSTIPTQLSALRSLLFIDVSGNAALCGIKVAIAGMDPSPKNIFESYITAGAFWGRLLGRPGTQRPGGALPVCMYFTPADVEEESAAVGPRAYNTHTRVSFERRAT